MRCGKCENCQKLEKVKNSVLACCGTPKVRSFNSIMSSLRQPPKTSELTAQDFHHADDGVVEVWNDQLRNLPCTGGNDDKRDSALQSL